jgi:hypothetical protein
MHQLWSMPACTRIQHMHVCWFDYNQLPISWLLRHIQLMRLVDMFVPSFAKKYWIVSSICNICLHMNWTLLTWPNRWWNSTSQWSSVLQVPCQTMQSGTHELAQAWTPTAASHQGYPIQVDCVWCITKRNEAKIKPSWTPLCLGHQG